MSTEDYKRKLTAILHADIAGYSRLMGDDDEAIATYKRVFDYSPSYEDALNAHVSLAIRYVESGQEANAKAEVAEVLKFSPNFSVEVYGERASYKDPAQTERNMAALRKAGLK